MLAPEIVVHHVKRHGRRMVLDFFTERIRQSREPAHGHPHREILAFDIAGADMLGVWVPHHRVAFAGDAFRRAVAPLSVVWESIDLADGGVYGTAFNEAADHLDRKSTRLNSSHLVISYAVFCLKK